MEELEKKVEVVKPFMARALKPWARNMKTNGLTFASMPNFTFFVASLKGMPLWQEKDGANHQNTTSTTKLIKMIIMNVTTRSEKEALKRRKKRTPTVAMTAEQYKAKRGILLATPKKTGWPLKPSLTFVFFYSSVFVFVFF